MGRMGSGCGIRIRTLWLVGAGDGPVSVKSQLSLEPGPCQGADWVCWPRCAARKKSGTSTLSPTASPRGLLRRADHRAVGAKDTAMVRLVPQQRVATGAFAEKLTGIGGIVSRCARPHPGQVMVDSNYRGVKA